MSRFVHLHLHTEYSLVDGVIRIDSEHDEAGKLKREGLVDAAVRLGLPALAITDHCNLFGLVKFAKTAQAKGIKPLVGVDVLVTPEDARSEPFRTVLLCQDERGYRNLTRLISRAYLEGQGKHGPTLSRAWLDRDTTVGLVALSGARDGEIGRALAEGRGDEAQAALERWLELFGDRYYLELQRTGRPGEEPCIAGSLDLAVRLGVPVVATNDVRFLARSEFESHEARVCIHEGWLLADAARPRRYSEEQYLKSAAEMAEAFADLPEALENSVELARRLNLELKLGKASLPAFPVPEGATAEQHLREESARGLAARMAVPAHGAVASDPAPYEARLGLELDVICQMGFAGYFLIVADFIRWARDNGVPVGPGRGSGAGSLVAWALGITDLDPLRYDLLFERFLNPERVSMPDFDIDFCMEGRDRVIDYVAERYGRERVSQIITYGTMAAKAVVRDVARVLGYGYGLADGISKLIPMELGITLDDALKKEEELRRRYKAEDEVREILDLARSLEGLVRNAGTHAGGVVIAPSVLTDFAPLYCEAGGGSVVTQFDKDDVEAAGLVKFDFLGLRTLTIIDWAVRSINRERAVRGEPPLALSAMPMDDPAAFALLKRCDDDRGVPARIARHEGPGQAAAAGLLRGHRRAGRAVPAGSAAVRHGRRLHRPQARQEHGPIDYLHPELKPVLQPTYGVILYQEQVMQIAQVLAGYTLGGADLLRRAMGKKKPEEMAKQRSVFVDGRSGSRGRGGHRGAHLRPDGEVRRLRLQQVALGRLRAAVLPDRLAEGAPPGALHGCGAVLGHGQHRQGRHADRRVPPDGSRGRAAGRERLAMGVRRVRAARDPLRARRHQGRRRGRSGRDDRGADCARPLHGPLRPLRPHRPRSREPARARGTGALRRTGRARPESRDVDACAAAGAAGRRARVPGPRRPGRWTCSGWPRRPPRRLRTRSRPPSTRSPTGRTRCASPASATRWGCT